MKAAVSDGSLNVLDGSDSGSFYLSRHQTLIMPRAEAKSELAAAQKRGMLDQSYGETAAPSNCQPNGDRPVCVWSVPSG